MPELDCTVVEDVMTYRPTVVAPDDPLAHAARLFEEKGFDLLPVCLEGRLVGVLSHQDLLRACAPAVRPAGAVPVVLNDVLARPVAGCMSRQPATVEAQAPLAQVLEKFIAHGVYALPVVFGALLVGIVSRRDVVRALRMAAGTGVQVAV